MRNNILLRSVLILILTCFYVFAASCCTPAQKTTESPITTSVPGDDPVAASRQATVDAMRALPSGYETPITGYDGPRLEGWFDVNQYFSVLTHLSMQPGYILDYVYHSNGSGGQPCLYANKIDDTPYSTSDELAPIFNYLSYVRTDDTEESFFQYVTLRIMGGQFYLWWHANYDDHTIICDRMRLEALLAGSIFDQNMPPEVQEEARRLELAPGVEINKDTVIVRVVVFTKWGGFMEETYTITRAFPHTIEDIKTKTLVPWRINLTF